MFTRESSIYVAGHTGLVGSAIVRKLNNLGFSNLILKTHDELDLLQTEKVNNFFASTKPEYVIIAAARVGGIKANMTYPADFLYENLQIQNNLLWAAMQNDAKKVLFLGSSCAYPRNSPQPMKEECLLEGNPEPTNEGYALAKIAGVKLCEKIFEQYGKKFISCMPTNIYGPGDTVDPLNSHVIPALMYRMHQAKINNEKEVVVWGSGNIKREFLYVDDLADAVVWMMENYDTKEFLNIGTGTDVSIKELALLIQKVVSFEGKIVFDASKPDGMPRKLLDVSKINNMGWKAKTGLEDGLVCFYEWFLGKY
jgi:GDP-L-fucose synthase